MNTTSTSPAIVIDGTRQRLKCGGAFCSLRMSESMYIKVESGDIPWGVQAVNNGIVLDGSGILRPGASLKFEVVPPRDCPPLMCGLTPVRLGVFSVSLYACIGENWRYRRPLRTESFLYGSDWELELLEEYLRSCDKQRKPVRPAHMDCIPGCVHPDPVNYRFSYN